MILKTNKTELLISTNNRYFTEALESDFDECQTISTIRLCKSNILPLYNSIEKDSCLLHLLFSPATLSTECKYTVLKVDNIQTVVIQNVLFVYKNNRDNVRIECENVSDIINLQSFSLQSSCSLFGADYRIVGRKGVAITVNRSQRAWVRKYVPSRFNITKDQIYLEMLQDDASTDILSQDTIKIIVPTTGIVCILVFICVGIMFCYGMFYKKKIMGKIDNENGKGQLEHRSI